MTCLHVNTQSLCSTTTAGHAVFCAGCLSDRKPLYSEKYDSVPLRMLSSLCGVGLDSSMPCSSQKDPNQSGNLCARADSPCCRHECY